MNAPVTIPAKQATDTTILNPVIIPNKAIIIITKIDLIPSYLNVNTFHIK